MKLVYKGREYAIRFSDFESKCRIVQRRPQIRDDGKYEIQTSVSESTLSVFLKYLNGKDISTEIKEENCDELLSLAKEIESEQLALIVSNWQTKFFSRAIKELREVIKVMKEQHKNEMNKKDGEMRRRITTLREEIERENKKMKEETRVLKQEIEILRSENNDLRHDLRIAGIDDFDCSEGIIRRYKGQIENFRIPSFIGNVAVKSIENVSMRGKDPDNWPNGEIGPFEQSCIERITIPSTLEIIGDYSFSGCFSLISVEKNESKAKLDGLVTELELKGLMKREVKVLSGGELQRLAIVLTLLQVADAAFFDEPSSFLDIKQRMSAAKAIRDCVQTSGYVVVIEHDLAILDYMSDLISVLYGIPGAYGVISAPFNVREGINHFLKGFIPTENMRFRKDELVFRIKDDDEVAQMANEARPISYPATEITLKGSEDGPQFHLKVEGGDFRNGEIIVLLGQNGVGKSTFIKVLARQVPTSDGAVVPELSVSYKPQKIDPHFKGTVNELLTIKIRRTMSEEAYAKFEDMVLRQLNLDLIMDRNVKDLSGGELQRVAIALVLGKNAQIYLIDEPSAYLDAEQRVVIAKIIKRYVMNTNKTAFIVEHDFMMATYLADRVIVFDGTPGVSTIAKSPEGLYRGLNSFLRQMEITLRSEPQTHRPRINQYNSVLDREQKARGVYFALE